MKRPDDVKGFGALPRLRGAVRFSQRPSAEVVGDDVEFLCRAGVTVLGLAAMRVEIRVTAIVGSGS